MPKKKLPSLAPKRAARSAAPKAAPSTSAATPKGGRKTARQPLNAARIVAAALALVEEEGLDALSMRRLGAALHCEAMSLYHHFPSKAHLLDAMVDRVIGEMPLYPRIADPFERFRSIAIGYRAKALQHPRFFLLLGTHRLNTRVGLCYIDAVVGAIAALGLDAERSARIFRAVGYYLTGAVLDETAGYAKGPSAVEPVTDEEVERDFPNIWRAARYFRPEQHEATFLLGLDALLESIATR